MKKYVVFMIAVLFPLSLYAESFFEIEWSEFCPKRYQNINPDSPHLTSQGRYWADRKRNFNKRLEHCNKLNEESRSACLAELRELETKASASHNEEYRNKVLKYMLINSF